MKTATGLTGERYSVPGISLPKVSGFLCAGLAILISSIVLLGWALQLPALIDGAPDLGPMPPTTAICFVLLGLGLLGIVVSRPRLTFVGAAVAASLGAVALAQQLFRATGRSHEFWMSPVSALSFCVLAGGLVLAQIGPAKRRSAGLGWTGVVVAAVGATCGINALGSSDSFGLGSLTRMAAPTAAAFLLLGAGAVALALDMSEMGLRRPTWVSIGGGLFVFAVRAGWLQAFSTTQQGGFSSILAWLGALVGAVIFGGFVYFALKSHLQRELLRTANRRLGDEMLERNRAEEALQAAKAGLERLVEERTAALEALNDELRKEIASRKKVQGDLRRQKEILQTIFDHAPISISFLDEMDRIRMVNREWEHLVGLRLDQVVNQGIDLITERLFEPAEHQRARDLAARSTAEWEDFEIRCGDGRLIQSSWVVVRLSDGAKIGIGQDITARKKAEQEFRKHKEILQTIFDHIPVMLSFGDSSCALQLVNRQWEETLGWTLEEVRADPAHMLAENYPDPEYRKQVQNFMMNSHGQWADFKTRVRDGRIIDTSWVVFHLPDGTSIGMGEDITERKRAEGALRESEERFRQLAENINDLFWIKTRDLKQVLYMSPLYKHVGGREPEECYQEQDYSQGHLERIVPEDRPRMAEILLRGTGEAFDTEYRITRPDGEIRWIHERGFPIRDQFGQIYRMAGIARDITASKIAEQTLRESEERFRQIAENIHEVFWLTTPDLRQLLYLSPNYRDLIGEIPENRYQEEGARPLLERVHPDDLAMVLDIQKTAGQEFDFEFRIYRPDGSLCWIRDRGFPIRDQSGVVVRMGGLAEDITERKEAEERLKASSEQLRALSASLQSAREKEAARIARQIHDDIGGILTGLRWELEALQKTVEAPGDLVYVTIAIQDKLETMMGLTDSTINVVRRIASELRPSILDDLGLMEAIEWQTQQFQSRTGIQCKCHSSLQGLQLEDEQSTALFRIVQEALTNILRHAQASRVEVAIREEEGSLVLKVTDNGRGIMPAETFSRNSLGLLGMRERAHLIGGQVEIKGQRGTGTELQVRVPLQMAKSVGAS